MAQTTSLTFTLHIRNIQLLRPFLDSQTDPARQVWTGNTAEHYHDYRARQGRAGPAAAAPVVNIDPARLGAAIGAAIPGGGAAAAPAATPLETWLKRRRDATLYKQYKQKTQWPSWQSTFYALVRTDGCENVLDSAYTPVGRDQQQLVEEQKRYIFGIFATVLLESSSQEILRRYQDERDANYGDAQALYRDLKAAMDDGVTAKLRKDELEKQISTTKLDHSWTKTITAFLNHMAKLMTVHHTLVNPADYPDSWYITKINTSLESHEEMHTFVQSQELQDLNNAQAYQNVADAAQRAIDAANAITAAAGGGGGAPLAAVPARPNLTYQQHLQALQAKALVIDERIRLVNKQRALNDISFPKVICKVICANNLAFVLL